MPPLETTAVLYLQITRPWPPDTSAMPPACTSSPASCSCLVSSLLQECPFFHLCVSETEPPFNASLMALLSGAFPDPPPEETALPGTLPALDPADLLRRLHVSLTQLQPLRGQGPTSAMLVHTWYVTWNQSIFAEATYLPTALQGRIQYCPHFIDEGKNGPERLNICTQDHTVSNWWKVFLGELRE